MTVSHDYQIPGTVLQLAETKQSGMVCTAICTLLSIEESLYRNVCPNLNSFHKDYIIVFILHDQTWCVVSRFMNYKLFIPDQDC